MIKVMTIGLVFLLFSGLMSDVKGTSRSQQLDDTPFSQLQQFQTMMNSKDKTLNHQSTQDSEIDIDISSEYSYDQEFSHLESTSSYDQVEEDNQIQSDDQIQTDDELEYSSSMFELSDSSDDQYSEFTEIMSDVEQEQKQKHNPRDEITVSSDEITMSSYDSLESSYDDYDGESLKQQIQNPNKVILNHKINPVIERKELNLIKQNLETSQHGITDPIFKIQPISIQPRVQITDDNDDQDESSQYSDDEYDSSQYSDDIEDDEDLNEEKNQKQKTTTSNKPIFLQTEQSQNNFSQKQSITQSSILQQTQKPEEQLQQSEIQVQHPEVLEKHNNNPYLEQRIFQPKEIQLEQQSLDFLLKQQHYQSKQDGPKRLDQEIADDQLAKAMKQIQELQEQMQVLLSTQLKPQQNNQEGQRQIIGQIYNNQDTVDQDSEALGLMQGVRPVQTNEGKMSCLDSLEPVCKICSAQDYYLLDEENWYLIGLEHHYKREFQSLLQGVKNSFGESEFKIAFSDQNNICLSSKAINGKIQLSQVLEHFTKETLLTYLQRSMVQVPELIEAQSFQCLAKFDQQEKQFKFEQFKLILDGKIQPIQSSEQTQGIFFQTNNIEFSQENISIKADGNIVIGNLTTPFNIQNHGIDCQCELVRLQSLNILVTQVVSGILLPDQSELLLGIGELYFGDAYKDVMNRHLFDAFYKERIKDYNDKQRQILDQISAIKN